MTADTEIIAFLSARLDEDEATAKAAAEATPVPWVATGEDIVSGTDDPHWAGTCAANAGGAEAAHIARHDPARVLREVAAGRAIIERYKHAAAAAPPNANFTAGPEDGYRQACADAIRDLAAVWSDHPDHRPEWAATSTSA